jgi:aminopeptidase N
MKKFLKWFGIIVGGVILIIITLIAYILISHDRYGLYPSGGPLSENQSRYDVIYYGINLKVFAEDQAIAGYVDVKIKALDDSIDLIELDLIDNFKVSKISDRENNLLEFEHGDDKLMIQLKKSALGNSLIDLRVEYEGQPVEALFPPWIGGFNWSKDSSGFDWIGLSCQGEGAKIWMPCKDHPSDEPDSVAINITIPEPYYCAASGVLREITKPEPGFRNFHWITHYPINNYDINFNIGMYEVIDSIYLAENGTEMPVYFYVLPQSRNGAERHLAMAVDMLYTYRNIYGEYPFIKEKFALIETDYLGMEHQTLNSYGNKYKYDVIDSLEVDWLMLHEMGHEWWGNKVTAKDWADLWIHEGICTYGEALYLREKVGENAYHAHMDSIRSYVRNRKPIIPKRNATSHEVYSSDIYMKGACLMHSLRFILGDDVFFRMLKDFVTDSAYTYQNLVTTDDFINVVHTYSEVDYSAYLNDFLYTTNLPKIKIDSVAYDQYEITIPNIEYSLPMEITTSDTVIIRNLNKQPVKIKSNVKPIVDAKKWYIKTYFIKEKK